MITLNKKDSVNQGHVMRDNFSCNLNALSAACKVQEERIHVEHPILQPEIAALRVARKGRKVEMYRSTSHNAETS
jgi:hypothetical protein